MASRPHTNNGVILSEPKDLLFLVFGVILNGAKRSEGPAFSFSTGYPCAYANAS
jgi:hypothetical protein